MPQLLSVRWLILLLHYVTYICSFACLNRPHLCHPPLLDININSSEDHPLEHNITLSDIQEKRPSSTPLVSVANPTRLLAPSCLSMQPCQVRSVNPTGLKGVPLLCSDCFGWLSTTPWCYININYGQISKEMCVCVYIYITTCKITQTTDVYFLFFCFQFSFVLSCMNWYITRFLSVFIFH